MYVHVHIYYMNIKKPYSGCETYKNELLTGTCNWHTPDKGWQRLVGSLPLLVSFAAYKSLL